MRPDYKNATKSLHGACPIFKGSKIGLTLWICSGGQELRFPCPILQGQPFGYERLVNPKLDPSDWMIFKGLSNA